MTISNIMIFSGNANPNLALKTVEFLNMPLGKITAGKFSDGEVMVYKHDGNWECMDHERDVIQLNRLWNENKAFWKVW